ncbi:MAG: long-chain fatty acid--CoA ligase [Bacteroidales bacterium]|nr:long-chain fatty acid--CoA ligase [Bacteroidales bacterium]
MELKRLFDIPEYRRETNPSRPVFCYKESGEWKHLSVDTYIEKITLVGYGLLSLGLQRGDKVALVSTGRPEWNILDMAVQQIGCVLVPIYPTISEEDYRYILDNCEARLLFLESYDLTRKIRNVLPELEKIEGIYTFKPLPAAAEPLDQRKLGTLDDVMNLGSEHPQPALLQELKDSIGPRDLATIIYTSGTTGSPKGVMLCHENILINIHGVEKTPKSYFTRSMSFLPLCHIYERMMNYFYQYMGYETYYPEGLSTVVNDLKYARPYIMTAVPRFIEKMYDGIYRKGKKLKGFKRWIFQSAINHAQKYDLDGTTRCYERKRKIYDKLVYKTIRENFGGCLEMFVSGGAAIQPRLAKFFTCIGMDIYEGYGLTETAPVIAVSSREPNGRKLGTTGLPLPGLEVKILEDTNEVVCRGKSVMLGYYKDPELTAKAIDKDGWFHTGDTGAFEPKGQLRITGRTKTMFKTSMGKYINPEIIEERFKESPFIQDMMVLGENQRFAAALILPDFDFLKEWQERHGIHIESKDAMVADKKTLARFQRVVDKYNESFGATEQVKRFRVLNDSWTEANGCLTPTLKIKRNVVSRRCKNEIEHLFE